MRKAQIVGGSFLGFSKSASLLGDNKDVHPTYFEWDESPKQGYQISEKSPIFYCDGGLRKCTGLAEDKKVGWLVEPRHLHPENYEYAEKHQDKFDVILTYDKELLDACQNARFYPLGGSSISFDKWGIYPKTRDICMFVSSKNTTEGHKLRHEIVKKFKGRIDCYGKGVGKPVASKFEVLKDYRYCVVVESGKTYDYFSEKLIDPISVGTVPVYWGCVVPSGLELPYFVDIGGLFGFSGIREIEFDLESNLREAKQYRICEDWIYENYEDIFNVR